jgi:hypothetical protein
VDFEELNDRALDLLPDTYQVTHVRRGIDPDAGAAVKARLSEGAALVSYAGHGSVASWELDLLTTDDVPKLTNGSKLPLVVALTCLNGMFQSLFPEESLAEALVRAPGGGAVGVWASSGITSPQWQWRMNLELYRQIFQGGWLTISTAELVLGDVDVLDRVLTRLRPDNSSQQPAAFSSAHVSARALQLIGNGTNGMDPALRGRWNTHEDPRIFRCGEGGGVQGAAGADGACELAWDHVERVTLEAVVAFVFLGHLVGDVGAGRDPPAVPLLTQALAASSKESILEWKLPEALAELGPALITVPSGSTTPPALN